MRRLRVAILCASLGCGPARGLPPAPLSTPEPPVASMMTPTPVALFVDGPSINDAPALTQWMDAQLSARRLVRIPVVVEFDDAYRLAVVRAWIGNAGGAPPASAALLKLDDTGMSIALLDQLRTTCPAGANTCPVLLEGRWGTRIDESGMPPLDGVPAGPPQRDFTVLRLVGPADASALRVKVAGK